jgi:hypothetical protein
MIDEALTRIFVACGWIATTLVALATAFCAATGSFGLNRYNFADAVIFFGLAYGIHRRSRICAVAVLLYVVAYEALLIYRAHRIPLLAIIIVAVFFTACGLGVIGTFVAHAQDADKAAMEPSRG